MSIVAVHMAPHPVTPPRKYLNVFWGDLWWWRVVVSQNTRHHAQTRVTPGLQVKVVVSGDEFL